MMGPTIREVRIAYLVTHPIQYQAPLLRRVAKEPGIYLKAFFASDVSLRSFRDSDFNTAIRWDIPLLDGYDHEFLPAVDSIHRVSTLRPVSRGLRKRLRGGNFDVLWVHGYARPQHCLSMVLAKRLGMKVLLRDDATAISTERGAIKLAMKRAFFRIIVNIVDAFLVVGTLNRQYYLQHGVKPCRIFDVPWAVDNERFQARARGARIDRESLRNSLGLKGNRPVILFVGKLIDRKCPGDLLDAYSLMLRGVPEDATPYLLYVGDGELREKLQARTAALKLDSVKFLGFKNQTELPAFNDLCDVFVMPTVHEPWGLVVNEVMNAGRAVIVSDQVGCGPDLVEHGVNGFVFRGRDVVDLSHALSASLADPQRLAQMGMKSLERINRWDFEEDIRGLRAALTMN